MEMQDKEFDQLFNSKLNDFEMEPSDNVWQNIADELEGVKETKRSLVPYWSIAASVVVLVAASVLFFNREVKNNDGDTTEIVKGIKPVSPPDTRANEVFTEVEDSSAAQQLAITGSAVETQQKVKRVAKTEIKNETAPVIEAAPITEKPEPLIAANNPERAPVLDAVVANNDLNTATLVNQPEPIMDAPIGRIVDPIFENGKTKKRARGLGGLINTVIAAVDKREDKLIEFTDAENDEGTKLTAVNLGLFKIKKQQN